MWTVLDKALAELEKNNDIQITTQRVYVIGFLVKKMQKIMQPKTKTKKATL